LALLAAVPIAWPALCALFATVPRVLWAPLDTLRAAPDEARLDGGRLVREAVREPDFALAPLELERLREDVERPPPLAEPRLLAVPLFRPDFEVSWAILAPSS
jgi:hypothetical protein